MDRGYDRGLSPVEGEKFRPSVYASFQGHSEGHLKGLPKDHQNVSGDQLNRQLKGSEGRKSGTSSRGLRASQRDKGCMGKPQ